MAAAAWRIVSGLMAKAGPFHTSSAHRDVAMRKKAQARKCLNTRGMWRRRKSMETPREEISECSYFVPRSEKYDKKIAKASFGGLILKWIKKRSRGRLRSMFVFVFMACRAALYGFEALSYRG